MTYVENQVSISKWADATFGAAGSNARVAARANEEMAELIRAVTSDQPTEKIAAECADVVIVLMRLAERVGGVNLDKSALGVVDPYVESNAEQIATRGNRHMARMLQILTGPLIDSNDVWFHTVRDDLRHVTFWMSAIGHLLGFDLRDEIDKKMAINRTREWKRDDSGHGYHVRPKGTE